MPASTPPDGNRDDAPTTRSCDERNKRRRQHGICGALLDRPQQRHADRNERQARPDAHRLQARRPGAGVDLADTDDHGREHGREQQPRRPHRTAALRRRPLTAECAHPRAISTSATGTLITNSQRQLERSSSPPSSGPSRNAMPKTAPMSPSIRPRRSSGTVSAMTAAATGSKPPAPNAWIARPSNSAGNDQAAAASKRADAEQRETLEEHATPAHAIRTLARATACRSDRTARRQLKTAGNQRGLDREGGPNRRQRRPDDRNVEGRDQHAHEQDGQRGPLARDRHLVRPQ